MELKGTFLIGLLSLFSATHGFSFENDVIKMDHSLSNHLKKLHQGETEPKCDHSADEDRFDCHPELYASEESCHARGCCWQQAANSQGFNVPYCFFPSDFANYHSDGTGYSLTLHADGNWTMPFGSRIQQLKFQLTMVSDDIVRIKVGIMFI